MDIFSAIVLFGLLSFVASTPPSQQDLGFCSQIFNMHQYCSSQMSPTTTGVGRGPAIQPKVGKSGPRGPPGFVNYTAIDEKIMKKYSDLEERMEEKLKRLMDNFAGNASEFESRIEERFSSWKSSVESKIHEMKTEITTDVEDQSVNVQFSDCKGARSVLKSANGIVNVLRNGEIFEVYCDMATDGGNWTVFQRRLDGSVDFYRTWEEYAEGFGNKSGEFWLGLETMHQLTQDGNYELRVDLTDWDGSTAYAKYRTFSIGGRSDGYRLAVGGYSGTAGDSLTESSYTNNGQRFSAKDKDLDGATVGECFPSYKGAWWYGNCCVSNLNGIYNDTSNVITGVHWFHWRNRFYYSLKSSEMKFRMK